MTKMIRKPFIALKYKMTYKPRHFAILQRFQKNLIAKVEIVRCESLSLNYVTLFEIDLINRSFCRRLSDFN